MSYATGTTHYNLPVTTGSDKRDWSDTNQAFTDVDAALYGAVSDAADNTAAITALDTRVTAAEGDISDNAANITSLDTRLTTAEGAITSQGTAIGDVRSDLEDMICAYNEPTATSTHAYAIDDYFIYNDVMYQATSAIGVGDTIVPDTNCTTTNVSSELIQIKSDIPDVTQLQSDVNDLQTSVAGISIKFNNIYEYISVAGDTNGSIIAHLTDVIPTSNGTTDVNKMIYIIVMGSHPYLYNADNNGLEHWDATYLSSNGLINAALYPHQISTTNFHVWENGNQRNASADPVGANIPLKVYKVTT